MGGRPFSGKAKKAQLQAKRARKQQKLQAAENEDGPPMVHVKKPETTAMEGRTTRKGELVKNEKRSVFRKEERADVDKRKKKAMEEYTTRIFSHGVEYQRWWNIKGDSTVAPPVSLQIPRRPNWDSKDTDTAIESREQIYFNNYLNIINIEYGDQNLNLFEQNLEVWRQLWRVCESSHVVAVIADARHPLFHIPTSLIAYLRELKKPIMIVLNKIDLVPQSSVDAWMAYLTRLHPDIPIIPFTCNPNLETVTLELNDNKYRKRRLRDSKTKVNYNLYINNDDDADERAEYKNQEAGSESDDADSTLQPTNQDNNNNNRRGNKRKHGRRKAKPEATPITKKVSFDDNEVEEPKEHQKSKTRGGGKRNGRKGKRTADESEDDITLSSIHKSIFEGNGKQSNNKRGGRNKNSHRNKQANESEDDISLTSVHRFLQQTQNDQTNEFDATNEIDPTVNFKGMNKNRATDDEPARKKNQQPRRRCNRPNVEATIDSSDSDESVHEAFKGERKAITSELRNQPENAERLAVATMIQTLLETAKRLANAKDGEHFYLGTVGHPNVGKSSFINSLKGEKVVSTSATAGHTKHLQHIPLNDQITLCDCPGLTFPVVGLPLCVQVLMGSFPLAQNREPYTAAHYLGERIPIERVYNLSRPRCAPDDEGWSGYSLCEAFSEKSGFYLKRGKGLPDTHRGGQALIKEAVNGILILFFLPPPLVMADEEQVVLELSREPSFAAPTQNDSFEVETPRQSTDEEGIGGFDSDSDSSSSSS
eukprot:TRINITY_DN17839_c0_g1_i1.p1 TRINITY_DN17839_c0_g1~~TRINITY_DN17839_c0_g1_i1.p1  ORF type:complete len:764 (+),score=175.21 TRINITY_DN17839_c0_g1_i1:96-2387(+)